MEAPRAAADHPQRYLDFSKVDAGRLELECVDFDIRSAVRDVVALLAGLAGGKGLALLGTIEPTVPDAIRGDPGRFRQVLMNLIGNAIKFTGTGEVVASVRLAAEDADTLTPWHRSATPGSALPGGAEPSPGLQPKEL